MALASGEGLQFLLRWLHFLAGITWIGMLYYFNFVQTPFFATAEPQVRSGMIVGSLVGRALWWFRWGAMFTFITGAAKHLTMAEPTSKGAKIGALILLLVVLAAAEINAMVGTTGPGKKMLSTLTGTFWGGFILTAILYFGLAILLH